MVRLVVLSAFVSSALLLSPFSHAFDNGDFQYWNTEDLELKFHENCKIKIKEEFRFGDSAGTFYYNHTEAGLSCPTTDYFESNLGYRQIFTKRKKDWYPEHMPNASGTVKINWAGFGFKDRNRFELLVREGAQNSWRYRNKLDIDFPFKWTPLKVQPYIADEIFYDFSRSGLMRNRGYAGFKISFLKNLAGEIYYMCQSTKGKGKKWKSYNVFGTKIKLMF